jgi:hypothetical protein
MLFQIEAIDCWRDEQVREALAPLRDHLTRLLALVKAKAN